MSHFTSLYMKNKNSSPINYKWRHFTVIDTRITCEQNRGHVCVIIILNWRHHNYTNEILLLPRVAYIIIIEGKLWSWAYINALADKTHFSEGSFGYKVWALYVVYRWKQWETSQAVISYIYTRWQTVLRFSNPSCKDTREPRCECMNLPLT